MSLRKHKRQWHKLAQGTHFDNTHQVKFVGLRPLTKPSFLEISAAADKNPDKVADCSGGGFGIC